MPYRRLRRKFEPLFDCVAGAQALRARKAKPYQAAPFDHSGQEIRRRLIRAGCNRRTDAELVWR